MDTSLDNANNPFANSNGADNNILTQKNDGLLLNLSENFKQNGADLSPAGDYYHNNEKSNGKRLASEFDDDDDLGPETDVDAIDDVLSPSIVAAKALAEGIVNNNPDGSFNPFVEKHEVEKAALEIDLDLQKQQSSEFDGQRSPREETPTPPADAVHDGGLEDNIGESGEESEDEWNYIKGEEANKENISPLLPDREVAELLEQEQDMSSQLNPDAAEFVPISPTRSIPSPACRALINDPVISQSPKRPSDIDISVPNPQEFEHEVKSRPSDFDSYSNGHDNESEHKTSSQGLIENLLNGKNIDEIPEFQPGTTPSKVPSSEEFHFGPNATPFTPGKLLDQSEAALSTKANYGDESTPVIDSTLDSSLTSRDNVDFTLTNKEDDPMSMSFYQDKAGGDVDPFDLNKVQLLPENLDDFLNKSEEPVVHVVHDNTMSDFSEHDLRAELISNEILLNNDERIQTTDLDKIVDDEKELASPVSNEEDLLSGTCELSKSPHPEDSEDLLGELVCNLPKDTIPELCRRPESASPRPELQELSKSPQPELEELARSPEPELEELAKSPQPELGEPAISPQPELREPSISPHPELIEPAKSPRPESRELPKSPEPELEELAQSPEPELEELAKSPEPELEESAKSPETQLEESLKIAQPEAEEPLKSPQPEIEEPLKSPQPEIEKPLKSPQPVLEEPPKSPQPELLEPVCNRPDSKSPELIASPEPAEEEIQKAKSPELQALSPEPQIVSPEPEILSPEPQIPSTEAEILSPEPVPQALSPKPQDMSPTPQSISPVPQTSTPEPHDLSPSPQPKALSPEPPKEELSLRSKSPELETITPEPTDDLCVRKTPELEPEHQIISPEPEELVEKTPQLIGECVEEEKLNIDERKETPLESPIEDVTSSVKDVSSPITSPIPDQIINEPPVQLNFAQEISTAVQATLPVESSSPIKEENVSEVCPISSPKSVTDTESVQTADVNSFLERSQISDITSPLSPGEQPLYQDGILDPSHPLMKCVYPLPTEIKTETIAPEFAEPAVLTPTEPIKEETPSVPSSQNESVKEPEVGVEETSGEAATAAAVAAGVAATAAAAAVAVAATEKKAAAKTKTPTATKKPPTKTAAASPTKSAASPTKAKAAPAAKARPLSSTKSTTGVTASKTSTGAVPKQPAVKPAPKPKTSTPQTTRTTEKKPLTNGDVKIKSTVTAKKSLDGSIKSTSSKPTTANKTSPTKPAAPRPTTAPAKTTTTTRTAPTTTAAPKPRPSTLTKTTTASTNAKTTTTLTTVKSTVPKTTAPKTTSPPKTRPATAPAKPRVPLNKSITKASADTEKQNKDSANKLTASRTVTSTRTAGTASSRSVTTNVRKTETKTTGATRTTLTKTTTTTRSGTTGTGKKPLEITRNVNKTKTTKIEKPVQNGVTTVVTEQITMVNNAVNEGDPQLIKDNSPIDNKLIVETNAAD